MKLHYKYMAAVVALSFAAPDAAFSCSNQGGNWNGCWGNGWQFNTAQKAQTTVQGDAPATQVVTKTNKADYQATKYQGGSAAFKTSTQNGEPAQNNGSRSGAAPKETTTIGTAGFQDVAKYKGATATYTSGALSGQSYNYKKAPGCAYSNGKWTC